MSMTTVVATDWGKKARDVTIALSKDRCLRISRCGERQIFTVEQQPHSIAFLAADIVEQDVLFFTKLVLLLADLLENRLAHILRRLCLAHTASVSSRPASMISSGVPRSSHSIVTENHLKRTVESSWDPPRHRHCSVEEDRAR